MVWPGRETSLLVGGTISWPSSIQTKLAARRACHVRFEFTASPCAVCKRVAGVRNLGGGLRRHVEKPVAGSRKVNEDVAGANAVEDRGRGELRGVDDGGRAADGADLDRAAAWGGDCRCRRFL